MNDGQNTLGRVSINTLVFNSGFTTLLHMYCQGGNLPTYIHTYRHKTMDDLISLIICLFFLFQLEEASEISLERAVSSLSAQ